MPNDNFTPIRPKDGLVKVQTGSLFLLRGQFARVMVSAFTYR
ncbi:MAG: hypothetical protein ACTTI6_11325 [Treponema sp.]